MEKIGYIKLVLKSLLRKRNNILYIVLVSILSFILVSCNKVNDKKLYVYNWGIYLADGVIESFEKKYGIDVIYDTFDTNEEMYAIVKENARKYDVLCPTDYMIEKMMNKDLLYKYDISSLTNYKNIDKDMLKIMQSFDKENRYAVPYVHSTLGLIYNKTLLDEKGLPYPTSWADLFNPIYKNEIIMQDVVRDVMMVGLKKNHYSLNTTDIDEINKATKDLIEQSKLVNCYAIDQARDKMALGEASISVMYSGEVEYIESEGKKYEYEYILPSEGVNFTIDAWVIPKESMHKEYAKLWIDYMLDRDIAVKNFDYMHYGIANLEAIDYIKNNYQNETYNIDNKTIFPDLSCIDKYEIYKDIGEYEEVYLDSYKKIKSE